MYKVGLSIVISLLGCVAFYAVLPWHQHEVFVRIFIMITMLAGLCTAYKLNLVNIQRDFEKKNDKNIYRIKQKMWVISGIWLLSIFFSYLMYQLLNQQFYFDYYFDALLFSPLIWLGLYSWTIFIDQRQEQPHDQYVDFFLDCKSKQLSWEKHKLFVLSNAVKIFYIPFMYGAAFLAISQLLALENIWQNPLQFIKFLFILGICFDVCIGLGGYLFSSKFFATEMLSVDESWQGWLVCLICYPPLLIIFKFFTEQVDSYVWSDWLAPHQALYWIWAIIICGTWICYWLATVSFGFKFSNLSWRGLVKTGLYRYVKHPAYLSKNIYWWLHTVPFWGVMGWDIVRNFLALTCVSTIYYLRAKTEERHLMHFTEYREYQIWIAENGLWAKFTKIIKAK